MLFDRMCYRELEQLRRSQTGGKYHDSIGKGELAIDACLELANRYLSQFPQARTRDGFARQGNYVVCGYINHVQAFYTNSIHYAQLRKKKYCVQIGVTTKMSC